MGSPVSGPDRGHRSTTTERRSSARRRRRGAAVPATSVTPIVMTSNLGASAGAPPGFGDGPQPELGFREAVRKYFRPELVNRLDEIVAFRNLSLEDVQRIVDLEIARVARRHGFTRRGIRLEVSAAARDRLARLGWHPSRGARPLKRVIEERVVTPAAVRLSEDPKLADVTLRVACADEDRVACVDEDRVACAGEEAAGDEHLILLCPRQPPSLQVTIPCRHRMLHNQHAREIWSRLDRPDVSG